MHSAVYSRPKIRYVSCVLSDESLHIDAGQSERRLCPVSFPDVSTRSSIFRQAAEAADDDSKITVVAPAGFGGRGQMVVTFV